MERMRDDRRQKETLNLAHANLKLNPGAKFVRSKYSSTETK